MKVGPPDAAISLRADKSFDAAYDLYIGMMEDFSGDCQSGRMATGLNINATTFASLPPRFHVDRQPSSNVLRSIISGLLNYPASDSFYWSYCVDVSV